MQDELIRIAEKRSVKALRRRLSEPPTPTRAVLDEALRYAAMRPAPEMVRLLLDAGADPAARNAEDDQVLAHAAMGGDPVLVREMIRLGCDVNHANINGRTPLVWAGWFGRVDSVRILVAAGAELDHAPRIGGPAIFEAARSNHFACVAELARLGAAVEVTDENDYDLRTPLMLAAGKGEAECCALLLDCGADIERSDRSGMRPLMHAANKGDPATVRLLLERGANPAARDNRGRTALGWASPFRTEAVALLAGHTGPIDETPPDGETPLLRAALAGSLETVKLYLEHGARVQPSGASGRSALTVAVFLKRTAVIDHLLGLAQTDVDYPGHRAGFPSLVIAASNGDVETLEKLMSRGARLDIRDADGGTALHAAAHHGQPQAAASLHARGLGLGERDDRGRTPLLRAAELARLYYTGADYPRLLSWLVGRGADPNAADNAGFTPLMHMVRRADPELLRVLVGAGADVSHATEEGESALSQAVSVGYMEDRYSRPKRRKDDPMARVIDYLVEQGADPKPGGRSLVPVAEALRCPQVAKTLRGAKTRFRR